ncbi:MAG: ATP-binding protein [Panacagrimonas sp.]
MASRQWLEKLQQRSLRSRLLVSASVVLAAFFLVTGVALENALRDSAEQAQRDKLEGLVYALLAATTSDRDGGLTIDTAQVPDPRLRQPTSGLRAAMFDESGIAVWTSVSYLEVSAPHQPGVGQWRFERLTQPMAFAMSYGLRWIDLNDDPKRYTVVVLEDSASLDRQLKAFRRELFSWLAAAAAALLTLQVVILAWGLAPLRRLVKELRGVENGDQTEIRRVYPAELQPLTDGLNAMIRSERSQQGRYRNALGDLAHSLKTPLAVLRGYLDSQELPASLRDPFGDQLGAIQQIADHQLRKAATAGRRVMAEPVAVLPVAEKIAAALQKVYAGRVHCLQLKIDPRLRIRADNDDLYELLGNLLDNACKYGDGQLRCQVRTDRRRVLLEVEDNGPGFPVDAASLLQRGVRADSQQPGQGIGLAAVVELVRAYEGEIELGRSDLGGARVSVSLPV